MKMMSQSMSRCECRRAIQVQAWYTSVAVSETVLLFVRAGTNKLAIVDRRSEHNGNAFTGIQHIGRATLRTGHGVSFAVGLCPQVRGSKPWTYGARAEDFVRVVRVHGMADGFVQVTVSESGDAASVFASSSYGSGNSAARAAAAE